MYAVKEIYYTLQGEGAHAGRASVFLRFAGCNLWTGREKDRPKAVCQFCDTDFVGVDGENGGRFKDALQLAWEVRRVWEWGSVTGMHGGLAKPYVVCTGGEPLLQLDAALYAALKISGFEVAVETNGTIKPEGFLPDWICVSPKANAELKLNSGNELKLVYPQVEQEAHPSNFDSLVFDHFFLQPKDGPDVEENTRAAVEYCMKHPWWRLSLQTHKLLKIK